MRPLVRRPRRSYTNILPMRKRARLMVSMGKSLVRSRPINATPFAGFPSTEDSTFLGLPSGDCKAPFEAAPTAAVTCPLDSQFQQLPRPPIVYARYVLGRSRGAEFITEPKDKYGEIRCSIHDPEGSIIEVGQSTLNFTCR